MPGKPKKLTPEPLARAQALVDAGYRLKDVASRFGVAPSQLNRYGVRARPGPAVEAKEPSLIPAFIFREREEGAGSGGR